MDSAQRAVDATTETPHQQLGREPMPSYDIVNARFGVLFGKWDVAFFANNLTDERAFLALDRERGLRARVGYLTNQPRTFGITARFNF